MIGVRMADLADALRNAPPEQPRARPLPEAVADELRYRFARLIEHHSFQPGDLVIGKPGVCHLKEEFRTEPRIVIDTDIEGYLVPMLAGTGVVTSRPDIAVMDLVDGIGVIRLVDSRTLMPWQPPEGAAR